MASINVASVDATVVPDARAFREKLDAQLRDLKVTVDIELIDRQVQAELDRVTRDRTVKIKATVDEKSLTAQGDRAGRNFGGAFGREARARMDAALRALPEIEVDATTSEADRKIAELRDRLLTLRDQRIGVDVPTDKALAEIEEIRGELQALGAESPDITVRVNTGKATAELAKFRAELEGIGGSASGGAKAGGGGVSTGSLIFAGIAAAAALVGPVVGAATAAVGEFAGAVGAAVLAYHGFKQEVAAKSALGQQITTEIDQIKGAFDRLGAVAANAAGPSVVGALQKINNYLVTMDGPVANLSEHLGRAFNISADGLISALDTMQPLLQDAGIDAEHLAAKFRDFAQSQDFRDFIAYARQELPRIIGMMESLTKGVVALAQALAPVGDLLVDILNGTGIVLQKLGPALTRIGEIGTFDFSKGGPKEFFDTIIHGSSDGAKATKKLDTATKQAKTTQDAYRQAVDLTLSSQRQIVTSTAASRAAKRLEAAATDRQTAATSALNRAMDEEISKQATLAGGQIAVDQALLSMTKTLKENKGAMSRHTQAGIDDRQAILSVVTALQSQRQTSIKTGTATDTATRKYQSQATQLLDNIKRTQGADSAAYHYAQRLLKIPKDVKTAISTPGSRQSTQQAMNVHREIDAIPTYHRTKVSVDAGGALLLVRQVNAAINALHDRHVTVTVTQQNAYNKMAGMAGVRRAGGGPVYGPGTSTSDSIPAMLSNHEFVMKADAVRKYGLRFMEDINAMRLAGGGFVGQRPATAATGAAPIVNIYPRANQSEREIGTIAAREIAWGMRA